MARITGRYARVYLGIASGGTAEPVPFLSSLDFSAATDTFDVSAFGDGNKVYVSGLPDASGSFSGFYDDATAQTYTAAADGLPRKMYLYSSTLTNTTYWFGTVIVDFKFDASVTGAASIGASWKAASSISKVG